jgi:hypothetical protein
MPETVGPIPNAAELPEGLVGTAGKPSSGKWTSPKPLEKMTSAERQEWLRGDDPSKWSDSSLSAFQVPDAPPDDKESDKSGDLDSKSDVSTIENLGSAKSDEPTGTESKASEPEAERHERHTKAYNDLPARMARELATEFQEASRAGQIPCSAELGEFLRHTLADSENPAKIYKALCANPALVAAMHNMSGQGVLGIIEDLDRKVAPQKEAVRVTRAPSPAREIGGRGSSSGDDENRTISQGDFRAYKRTADRKAAARSR